MWQLERNQETRRFWDGVLPGGVSTMLGSFLYIFWKTKQNKKINPTLLLIPSAPLTPWLNAIILSYQASSPNKLFSHPLKRAPKPLLGQLFLGSCGLFLYLQNPDSSYFSSPSPLSTPRLPVSASLSGLFIQTQHWPFCSPSVMLLLLSLCPGCSFSKASSADLMLYHVRVPASLLPHSLCGYPADLCSSVLPGTVG